MEKKYKLRVNDQYEFQFTTADLASLDLIQTAPDSLHLLQEFETYHIAIDEKNFNGKSYGVKVNNTAYKVSIADSLDMLIDDMASSWAHRHKLEVLKPQCPV